MSAVAGVLPSNWCERLGCWAGGVGRSVIAGRAGLGSGSPDAGGQGEGDGGCQVGVGEGPRLMGATPARVEAA